MPAPHDPITRALDGTRTPGERAGVLLLIGRLLKESGYHFDRPQRGDHGVWVSWCQWLRRWRAEEMRWLCGHLNESVRG